MTDIASTRIKKRIKKRLDKFGKGVQRYCCNKEKPFSIKVRTPEGEQVFHLCEQHSNLQYFQKYQISREELS